MFFRTNLMVNLFEMIKFIFYKKRNLEIIFCIRIKKKPNIILPYFCKKSTISILREINSIAPIYVAYTKFHK